MAGSRAGLCGSTGSFWNMQDASSQQVQWCHTSHNCCAQVNEKSQQAWQATGPSCVARVKVLGTCKFPMSPVVPRNPDLLRPNQRDVPL